MREIKFRAWHTGAEHMYLAEEMGRDQLTLSVDGLGFINVHGTDTKLSKFYTFMLPEQYIGLKDKNGKEIYEGDRVRVGEYYEAADGEPECWMYDTVHTVVWGGKEYPAFALDPGLDTEVNDFAEIVCGNGLAIEVIGNIHEDIDYTLEEVNEQAIPDPAGDTADEVHAPEVTE